MWRFGRALGTLAVVASALACAKPTTPPGTVAPRPVLTEQIEQQQRVIEEGLRQQQRVEDIGQGLLAAATPFCGSALAPHVGVRVANVHSFPSEYQDAARSLGFNDTLVIVAVAQGSTAARSGFSLGDRVLAVDGGPPPIGPDAASVLARAFAARPSYTPRLTLQQGGVRFLADVPHDSPIASAPPRVGGQLRVAMPADTVCAVNIASVRSDEINVWAAGANLTVTSAMLRFMVDDDDLAAVLAHEIAHNVKRDVQGLEKSSGVGGLFGAISDIAAASQARNTPGESTKLSANDGPTVFSQDAEREADYLGMYVLARAGRRTRKVPNLWRRMAQENPVTNKYASAHPTTPERLARLDQVVGEIEQKLAQGADMRPEVLAAGPPPATVLAQTPAKRAAANRAPRTTTVLVDRSQRTEPVVVPKYEPTPVLIASAGDAAPMSTTTITRGDSVSYTFGTPVPRDGLTLAQVRRHAQEAFDDGREALELRLYQRAEDKFREAVVYDGGEARYHAALGAILLKRGKSVEAEAVFSAAVLLDVENAEYRRLLIEARKRQ